MTTIVPSPRSSNSSLKSLLKQAARFSATFVALIYIASPPRAAAAAPEPAGFDILGMKLGMNVAEIEAAIKAHDPSLKMDVAKISTGEYEPKDNAGFSGFLQFVEARRSGPAAENIVVGITVTQPARTFYIHHDIAFAPGQQPLTDKTVHQLDEKYGPESRHDNIQLLWVFDKAGKLVTGKQLAAACPGDSVYSYTNGSSAPRYYCAQYPIFVSARLVSSRDKHLLSTLSVDLVGQSIAADDIRKTIAEDKAAQERRRQEQERKAAGVKAPL